MNKATDDLCEIINYWVEEIATGEGGNSVTEHVVHERIMRR